MSLNPSLQLPIPYGRQEITKEDEEAVLQSLRGAYLTGGPTVKKFEEAFASYIGSQYAVACSSGTAALHLCSLALRVKPGDRVLCSPLTFVASTNCILYQGGNIDFVDIDPSTRLMDLDLLEKKLDQAPLGHYSGIIAVDFAGHPIRMDRVREIADRYGCWIIEDSCHAPGGSYQDAEDKQQQCGNGAYADLAIFSFHPVKHFATGEGGMVTTNDPTLYERLIDLRNHGITRNRNKLIEDHGGWYYEMQVLGYNYRLSDIHAALGMSQLNRGASGLAKRTEIAKIYLDAFKDLPMKLPLIEEGHAFHLFVIEVDNRKDFYKYLRQHEILSQIHYIPVHYQPFYQKLGWKKGDFPLTEAYYNACISLPMFPTLSISQQNYVIDTVRKYFIS
ncbi:MAG: UDP-4-amino-4,6-dideoxy-N-acetyl-beta-L-altrosamine transaminase [Bacteroidia bacterium]|nr:UDP-4-amino-4,6-dideoxy-N-acetyl-beta-L-altrosamine transaminase [Bacteroidia bacterium]